MACRHRVPKGRLARCGSAGFLDGVFTMKVLPSALTRYLRGEGRAGRGAGVSTCQLLVSLKLEKYSIENTTALQTLEHTVELRVVPRLAAGKC